MPRIGTESARTTLFQLEALVSAMRYGSFAAAASELGVRDKHRLIKAVERLAENLDIEGLSSRIGDEPMLPSGMRELEASASQILGAINEFERSALALRSRTVLVRCLAYPSMVTIFLADAAAEFERSANGQVGREVRFVDLESRNRREAGATMLRPLLARVADVVVGPTRRLPTDADAVGTRLAYSWQLVAAVHGDHPLQECVQDFHGRRVVDLADVARFPLLLSPVGHRSRDLLGPFEPIDGFDVELETSNSQARAALGRAGSRVPLIASDALSEADFESSWPAVAGRRDGGELELIGDSHSVYWRRDLPKAISQHVEAFAETAFTAAECLRKRPGGSLAFASTRNEHRDRTSPQQTPRWSRSSKSSGR